VHRARAGTVRRVLFMVRAGSFVRLRSQFDPDVQAFQLTGEISSRDAISAARGLPKDLRSHWRPKDRKGWACAARSSSGSSGDYNPANVVIRPENYIMRSDSYFSVSGLTRGAHIARFMETAAT
jgi:hypothetical protein